MSIRILPLSMSNNLRILLAIVLFPEPVEPIIPSESPAFKLNDILNVGVLVKKAKGEKCSRCWKILGNPCERCISVLIN